MKILKNKLLYFPVLAGLIVIGLLALASYPAYNPTPKSLPIAIVNLDKGIKIQDKTQNIGDKFVDKVENNKKLKKTAKFINVKSEKALSEGFDDNKYYGALVIPENFTKNATSAMRKEIQDAKKAEAKAQAAKAQNAIKAQVASGKIFPAQAQAIAAQMQKKVKAMQKKNADLLKPVTVKEGTLKIKINQGASSTASQISDNILKTMAENINGLLGRQAIKQLADNNVKVDAKAMDHLMNPVTIKHTILNKVEKHQANGNGGALLFNPIWMGSILSSVLLFFAFRTSRLIEKKDRVLATLMQIISALVTSFICGFVSIWFITSVLDFNMPDTYQVSLYISMAMFAFMMMILGIMAWLGMKAIPLFMILLFFSMQLLTLPKQMLSDFYQKYIITWNPFSYFAEGLRELIYLGKDLTFNTPVQMFMGMMIFGIVSTLLAAVIRKHSEKRAEVPA